MSEKNKKRQVAKITIFITSIFVILFSITYAFINQTLTGEKQVVVSAGVLDLVLEEENAITIANALPMYDEVGMIQEDVFKFRLVNKTANPTNYVLKMTKIAADNELSTSDVKYYLTKEGVGEPKLLSTLTDGVVDSGTIVGNDTIDYTLRLWIDSSVVDQTTISGKSLSYKIDIEVSQEIAKDSSSFVETKLFASENLGSNCKTYDDGVDTFLVGQCSNNYVWYSGKLWRVVLRNNETGAVKMVTDNVVTAITYNSNGNVVFANSYIDQWLQQEFLSTLHDYEDYLVVDSIWYDTQDANSEPTRPTGTVIERPVGLLNAYEYYTTYSKSDNLATNSTGYLNTESRWWLITPLSSTNIRTVGTDGGLYDDPAEWGLSMRAVINLKANIQIIDGKGIENDPYILEGDLQKPINGTTLLSSRQSGEYITFNDVLYRIVGVEDNLTKITAIDKPSELKSISFHNNNWETYNFATADIKTDLENFYQELKLTNEIAYNMIEPNTTWYFGQVVDGGSYKASICATVDDNISVKECIKTTNITTANIGLPRVGEMFTSQITRGKKDNFWTLTPVPSMSIVRVVSSDGYLRAENEQDHYGARPSMYLKQNVVIASNNTGNGTYEHPYKIELGA